MTPRANFIKSIGAAAIVRCACGWSFQRERGDGDPRGAYDRYLRHFTLCFSFDAADANRHHFVADYR